MNHKVFQKSLKNDENKAARSIKSHIRKIFASHARTCRSIEILREASSRRKKACGGMKIAVALKLIE